LSVFFCFSKETVQKKHQNSEEPPFFLSDPDWFMPAMNRSHSGRFFTKEDTESIGQFRHDEWFTGQDYEGHAGSLAGCAPHGSAGSVFRALAGTTG
jgi:hypothetical protein